MLRGDEPKRPRTMARGEHLGHGVADPTRSVVLTVYRPNEVLPPHEHEGPHLCLLLAGAFQQAAGMQERSLTAGEVGHYPAGDHHRNRIGPRGAVCLNIDLGGEIAPATFQTSAAAVPLRIAAVRLAQALAIGDQPDGLEIECLAAELAAPTAGDPPPGQVVIKGVMDALEQRPHSTLVEIAQSVGRHPTHLARAFRRATGLSIGAYRRRLRLQSLCVDLRTGSTPLSELALRHGYSDQAHMSRDVKSLTGRPPGAWRAR